MKYLVASTALAVILSTPAMAQDQQQAADEAFLQGLETGEFLAGDIIGQDIYVRAETEAVAENDQPDDEAMETGEIDENDDAEVTELDNDQENDEDAEAENDQEAEAEADQDVQQDQEQLAGQTITSDELEGMQTLGQVSEVVIDQQGEARGILLQVNDREVAVDMQHVSFAFDQDDPDQIYVIAEITPEELEQAPDFERERMAEAPDEEAEAVDEEAEETAAVEEDPEAVDEEAEETAAIPDDTDEQWRGDREAFAQPEVQREGMQQAEAGQISIDNLIGATVYDTQDNNIGDVDDVIAGEDGELEFVVVDVGGFLGIGTHTVALGLDEISILHDEGWGDVQVYVDATQEQLENLPEYAQN